MEERRESLGSLLRYRLDTGIDIDATTEELYKFLLAIYTQTIASFSRTCNKGHCGRGQTSLNNLKLHSIAITE